MAALAPGVCPLANMAQIIVNSCIRGEQAQSIYIEYANNRKRCSNLRVSQTVGQN